MRSYRTFKLALRSLRRNLMRASLTTLGIVIGVAAVIAMMEIGNGSSLAIQRTIASMGANNVTVHPGESTRGGVSSGSGTRVNLTIEDTEAIRRECPAAWSVAPVVRSRTQVVYGNRNCVPMTIYGTTPDFLKLREWETMAEGEPFSERDVRNRSRVCLIGETVRKVLFDEESPIGKEIRLQNVSFTVIGLLRRKGANMMGWDQDDIVLMPWTTLRNRVSGAQLANTNQSAATATQTSTVGATYPSGQPSLYPPVSTTNAANRPQPIRFANVDQIMVAARSTEDVPVVIRQVTAVLRDRHRLGPEDDDDFHIWDMAEMTRTMSATTNLMTNLLLTVAMISLLVGGVGIMNIMLVSVTERTREIGLRMSVGAEPPDILRQFLTESVVLCLLGGAMGILLGRGSSILVTMLLKWPTAPSVGAIIAAVVVSASVGIVFGYYPAWKASRLDPIEALRYE